MTVRDHLELYPPLMPFRKYRLPVSGGHTLYVEESGNPNGLPVIVLHGGPGGGSNPTMRRFHDPDREIGTGLCPTPLIGPPVARPYPS